MPTKARRTKADSPNALKYDSPKPIIEALIKTRGQQTIAADYLGISRKTLYDYRQRWPEIDEEIDTWRQRRLDRAEFKLDDAIENGESWAIMFFLNCLGGARGYGNKSKLEVTGADGQPIRIMTAQDLSDDELAKIATNQTE